MRFPKPAEKSAGGLFLPEASQLRPEFGDIADIGDPITDEERAIAARLRELQAAGKKIAVTYAAGVGYWRDTYSQAGLDKSEYAWLMDERSYRMTELAAFVEE